MTNMYRFKLRHLYFLFFLIFLIVGGNDFVVAAQLESPQKSKDKNCAIVIESQKQFDSIQFLVDEKIERGYKRIIVQLKGNEYRYKDKHLTFEGKDYSDVTIFVKGNNSKIVASVGDHDVSLKNDCSTAPDDNHIYEYWTPVYFVDSLIEVIDFDKRMCAAKCAEIKKNAYDVTSESYIQVTQWYHSKKYKITRIKGDKIFFIADDLKKTKDNYSINYDYSWHKEMPRFRLCNVESRLSNNRNTKVLNYSSGCFLRIWKSLFKSFGIENISFVGNNEKSNLFSVSESSFYEDFIVDHCSFSSLRGGGLYFKSTDNVVIRDNSFENIDNANYKFLILTDKNCEKVTIEKNLFNRCGLSLSYSICVFCEGGDYLISDNTFVDFGYCAIRCGLYYQDTQEISSKGLVEHNIIYYTKDYLLNISQYGLIDGGAIYIATKNDDLTVRYNYIHDISGCGSNRGIYCDDGAKNFCLYGNIILNIKNSRCIDARLDTALERFDKTQVANVNKVMYYNIIDGGLKFEGKPSKSNGCVKGVTYVSNNNKTVPYDVSNVDELVDNIPIIIREVNEKKIIVDRMSYTLLSQSPAFKGIKRYVSM